MGNELSLLSFFFPSESRHLKKLEKVFLATESGHKPLISPVNFKTLNNLIHYCFINNKNMLLSNR